MWHFYIACLLVFVSTTSLSWSSSAIPKLMNSTVSPLGRAITPQEATWLASSLQLGGAIGCSLLCFVSTIIGKKRTLLVSGLVTLFCNFILAFGQIIELYYFARTLAGIPISASLFILPLYVFEIVDKSKRVFVGSCLCAFACVGILFFNAVGPFFNHIIINLFLTMISVIYFIFFAVFGKESPQCYLSVDKNSRQPLSEMNKHKNCVTEYFVEAPRTSELKNNFRDILNSKGLRKGFITVCSLLTFQQLSGIDVVIFYGVQLFQQFDSNITPEISIIILSCFHTCSALVIPLVGVKYYNKSLLIFSGIGMAITQICLALYTFIQTIFHVPGFGPMPYIMLGEVFPFDLKLLGAALVGTIFWLVGFFITKTFFNIFDLVGLSGYFLSCSICCTLGVIFSKVYVLETKNKTLEDIQYELES